MAPNPLHARPGARVIQIGRKGYGAALMGGIEAASGHFVIMGDADGSYDFTDLDGFVEQLRAGFKLVIGNRFKGGIMPVGNAVLNRYIGNPALSFNWPCTFFLTRDGTSIAECAASRDRRFSIYNCKPQAWNSPVRW